MNTQNYLRMAFPIPEFLRISGLAATVLVGTVLASQAAPLSAAESVDAEMGPEIVILKPELMEPWNTGWTLNLDNDLFAGSGHDRDYTAGITLTLNGRQARERAISIDGGLNWFDRTTGFASMFDADSSSEEGHAMQFGFLLFTPEDILTSQAIHDDRPYANLIFLGNSHYSLNANQTTLYQSTLTIGLLGTGVGEALQSTIHNFTDGDDPQGYAHQISDGGELTARYSVALHSLLSTGVGRRASYDLKLALEASVGYLTEGTVALGLRWGRIRSPWWSSLSEYADYPAQPAPSTSRRIGTKTKEIYFSAGIKLRARAYNAFLQGQFRDSDVTFSSSELEPLLLEGWLGLTTDFGDLRVQYAFRYQTAEIKRGVGARDLTWAGITVSKRF